MRSRPVPASTIAPSRMSSDRGAACRDDVLAQGLAGLERRLAADAGGARRPGAAAVGRDIGVAEDDAHALERHAEGGRDHLRDDGLGALALLGDARLADDRPGRVEPHRGAVLRGDARAADAVEGGGRVRDLDEARKADAAVDALPAHGRLLGAQGVVAHHGDELVERGMVRQRLELEAGG
jgi:hypothetical protein